ncbi:hypothetical protein Pint_06807 [Pistacia integerrima]|uniref:Uncharacterized protein n=1 Tax=Pistacia integerrima TaxID=434235 RepID=A0ACC0XRC3_9ROSI|nr:hypothetical protein Pint_06807 [Pistacia integerrima]
MRRGFWRAKLLISVRQKKLSRYELPIVVRKTRWFLAAGAATWFGYLYGFPFMGDDLKMRHAVSLLKSNNPLYIYWGAHRLARYAMYDERRMKIVEIGGAQELVNMLWDAGDYYTRIQTLKALVALSGLDEAVGALHRARAISVVKSSPQYLDGAKILCGPLHNSLRLKSRNTSQAY